MNCGPPEPPRDCRGPQRKAALVRDVLGEGGFEHALTRDDLPVLLESD